MAYHGYILPEHRARIKEVMRSLSVNREYLTRKQIQAYKREFMFYLKVYPGIDFNRVAITI